MANVVWNCVQSSFDFSSRFFKLRSDHGNLLVQQEQLQTLVRDTERINRDGQHINRIMEMREQQRLAIAEQLLLIDHRQKLADQAEERRQQQVVETAHETELNRRLAENNPFFDPVGYVRATLTRLYAEEKKPLLLIAPFWDETQPYEVGKGGGLIQFRTPIARAWEKAPWSGNLTFLDGYFRRPLHQTNRDVEVIHTALDNLPVVLVYGDYNGSEVHLTIVSWNVMPGGDSAKTDRIIGDSFSPDEGQAAVASAFRRDVAFSIAHLCGLIGEMYGFLQYGRPVRRSLFDNDFPPQSLLANDWFNSFDAVFGGLRAQVLFDDALHFLDGYGFSENVEEGLSLLQEAALKGHSGANLRLGTMYKIGSFVPQSDSEAVKYFRAAAESGDPEGQYRLGVMYFNGRGVSKDTIAAIELYRKAAAQNCPEARIAISAIPHDS